MRRSAAIAGRRTSRGGAWTLGAAAALAAWPVFCGPALAQDWWNRAGNTPVIGRDHPEYDALGLQEGPWKIYPKVSLTLDYDDNIYGVPNGPGSLVGIFAPSVEFQSDWTRNAVDARFSYERDQYFNYASQSSNEFSFNSTSRLDVDHASAINFTLNAAQLTEPRTSPDTIVSLARPVKYDLVTVGASGYRNFARFRIDVGGTENWYSFYDEPLVTGAIVPESLRDENVVNEQIRLSYATSPKIAAFVEVDPTQSIFTHNYSVYFGNLNSSGYSALVGLNFELTHLMTGNFGVGYFRETYDAHVIRPVDGVGYNGTVQYFPTQLITVTLHADHAITASGVPGFPASDTNEGNLNVDYELLRNVILSANGGYARYDYPGSTLVTNRYTAGFTANYLLNRSIGLSASYHHITQSTSGGFNLAGIGQIGAFNFDDNQFLITLTLQR